MDELLKWEGFIFERFFQPLLFSTILQMSYTNDRKDALPKVLKSKAFL